MRANSLWLLLLIMLLTACESGNLQPRSGGRPYEVLIVGDTGNMVRQLLEEDVEGLPQPEPSFDVSSIKWDQYKGAMLLARAIVTVKVDKSYTLPRLSYEKNLNAAPQMIVHVEAPSLSELRQLLSERGKTISRLLTRAEMNTEIRFLREHHNAKAEEMIYRLLGVRMRIPADIQSSKKGTNFVWLSNDAPSGMRSICIYSVEAIGDITPAHIKEIRDSVMKQNIPGERQGMYMQTATMSRPIKETGSKQIIVRGLWDMRGDAMGGPYVLHILTAANRWIIAEAFVYAPEMKKRNLIRRTEATLYTLKEDK